MLDLDKLTAQRMDLMTVVESRLFDQRMRALMVPTHPPVEAGLLGSLFGWRIDPFTGRSALHAGLDYQSDQGTPFWRRLAGLWWRKNFILPMATWLKSIMATI